MILSTEGNSSLIARRQYRDDAENISTAANLLLFVYKDVDFNIIYYTILNIVSYRTDHHNTLLYTIVYSSKN